MPEALRKDRGQRPRSVHRPRVQFFSIRTSGPAKNIFTFFYLFLLKLLSVLLVTNSLLSAGGQDGKIPPAHEPIRFQDSFYLARSRAKKKNALNLFQLRWIAAEYVMRRKIDITRPISIY